MALDGRQPQANHLPGKGLAGQLWFELAQAAALAQHQVGDAPLLALREARRVDMGQQVSAVAVVVVVRHHQAEFMQGAGPAQFTSGLGVGVGQGGVEQRHGNAGDPAGLTFVDIKAALQLGHRGVAHVARQHVLDGVDALVQVDDHALAQRALGRPQFADAEVRGQRVQDGQAPRQHGAALGLQAGQFDPAQVAGLQAALDAPAQAVGRDAAVGDARVVQHVRHRAGRARRAQCLLPAVGREELQGLLELGARCHLRGAKALLGQPAITEEAHRQADATHAEGFGHQRQAAAAQDEFGRTAADVDDQPRVVAGLQVGHAGVDQARFLTARDDFDGEAQGLLRTQQEGVAVARLAQCLRGHGADLARLEPGQASGKAAQAGQAALNRFFGQQAFGVETATQAHHVLEVVDTSVASMLQLGDLQPEAVGAHVDCGQRVAGGGRVAFLHGPIVPTASLQLSFCQDTRDPST